MALAHKSVSSSTSERAVDVRDAESSGCLGAPACTNPSMYSQSVCVYVYRWVQADARALRNCCVTWACTRVLMVFCGCMCLWVRAFLPTEKKPSVTQPPSLNFKCERQDVNSLECKILKLSVFLTTPRLRLARIFL